MAAFAYSSSADGTSASTYGFASLTGKLRSGPVVCGTCGCRLEERSESDGSTAWFHFSGANGRDARGCAIVCSGFPHDAAGDALSPF
jgi:hypothetical protein